jgi:hypothetical protein
VTVVPVKKEKGALGRTAMAGTIVGAMRNVNGLVRRSTSHVIPENGQERKPWVTFDLKARGGPISADTGDSRIKRC